MVPSYFSDRIQHPLFQSMHMTKQLEVSALKLIRITMMVDKITRREKKYCTYLCALPQIIYCHSMVNQTTLQNSSLTIIDQLWEEHMLDEHDNRALFFALKLNAFYFIYLFIYLPQAREKAQKAMAPILKMPHLEQN